MEHIIAKLLQEFEHGRMSRRQLIKSLAATAASSMATSPAAAGAAEGRIFKARAFNHVSYQVADYRKSRDFYAGLFGMNRVVRMPAWDQGFPIPRPKGSRHHQSAITSPNDIESSRRRFWVDYTMSIVWGR